MLVRPSNAMTMGTWDFAHMATCIVAQQGASAFQLRRRATKISSASTTRAVMLVRPSKAMTLS